MTRPQLIVEGRDDLFLIANLLQKNGVNMDASSRPIEIIERRSVELLLESLESSIKAATDHPIGFVLDSDIRCQDRWRAVKDRIGALSITLPDNCPEAGYIGRVPDYKFQFGVWLMPDNKTDYGKLEDFISQLVPEQDTLLPYARKATKAAREYGAKFSDNDEIKAIVHSWLAWQKEPGLPFGTALNASFLDHKSPFALPFLKWIYALYGIIPNMSGTPS